MQVNFVSTDITFLKKHESRFWSKVERQGEDQCWIWKGGSDPRGYGRFYAGDKAFVASRIALALSLGMEIPKGLLACHRCDNPPCVNPNHLFLGSDSDNQIDAFSKNRRAISPICRPGSLNGSSRLTEDEVSIILALKGEMMQIDIAPLFGVNSTTITLIHGRKTWRHVTIGTVHEVAPALGCRP